MNASVPVSPLSESQQRHIEDLASTLNDQQLEWVQGYLAGYRAGQASGAPSAPVASSSADTPLTIVYGSQTGNAENLAQALAQRAGERGLTVECLDLNDYPTRRLKKQNKLAIITSTHGEGDPPDNALALHEFLHGRKAPKLAQLQYAVLALGDSSYEYFCQTGVDFDERLHALGGTRLLERVDCDVDYEEQSEQWMEQLLDALSAQQTTAPQPGSPLAGAHSAVAAKPAFDRKRPFSAPLLERINLNGRGSSKAVYHIEFSLEGSGLRYKPGDSLGVYAQNDPALIARILQAAELDGEASVTLKDQSVTLQAALRHHRELTRLTPPTVKQWATMAGSDELQALVDDKRALMDWLHGRDLLDLVERYPIAGLTPQALVDTIRRLPPRLYSIASSQAAVDDEVHLTVAAVRYQSDGRQREGVGSTWLADRLTLDADAPVFIDSNKKFHLPEDPNTPIIMIGPGTGVAPFRAFLQEREALEQPGKNWLFFGDRNFRTDFLYQREWLQWRKAGLLSRLDVAFSRDGDEKVYVQQRLRERGADVWQWLNEGAVIYICGDANAMAPDVHEALLDIIAEHGQQSRDSAARYLLELGQQKRYQRDVY
jgi:sulfite reductase (NADPH) flavoprotein alpha-component